MNKSIEYIKNTILNKPETINIPKDGWDKAIVINPMKKYKELEPKITINNNKFEIRLECNEGQFINSIEYNPNVEFDYFTSEISTHDGTLIFKNPKTRQELRSITPQGFAKAFFKANQ